MSRKLEIVKAKPNPAGKDKVYGTPKPEQLLGEWVDIKNTGTESIPFSVISLSHTLFDNRCNNTGRIEPYWKSSGDYLAVGQTIRVHTGKKSDSHLMNQIDRAGCDWHGYANRENFVLNNACGDIITVTWTDSFGTTQRDTVSYSRNQPEGAILERGKGLTVVSYSRF